MEERRLSPGVKDEGEDIQVTVSARRRKLCAERFTVSEDV